MLVLPNTSTAEVLTQDTVWSGRVTISDDVLVPEGVTLTVLPGAIISIDQSERTKTDPEYLSSLTEITVRGSLRVEGDKGDTVVFHVKRKDFQGLWAGIIVDGGTVNISSSRLENAETGIHVIKGYLKIKDSLIRNNRYGLVADKEATVKVESTSISENSYGVYEFTGSKVSYRKAVVKDNSKKDLYLYGTNLKRGIRSRSKSKVLKKSAHGCVKELSALEVDYKLDSMEISRKYGEGVILADTVWRGRIEISGQVRVPENVRLVIMPGTIVEFRKKDTNGDGIGENGIMMQGVLIAKGTKVNPIIFRSAEIPRRMGDWGAINIMNSDGVQNLLEYVQIEDGYRGLHFHFSNVLVNASVLKNNYRAIQFQESEVELRGNYIYNNKSGVKARDSGIVFRSNYVMNNINGVNFFRTNLTADKNYVLNNSNQGFKIREGTSVVRDNAVDCNRYGLMINESFFGSFERNLITNNYETGISLKDSDNAEIRENFIYNSGINGINLLSSGGSIKGNHISWNGERGIGIQSFSGTIVDNSITKNGKYAIENESSQDILAPLNWWGRRRADKVIYDKFDDRTRGMVIFSPSRQEPEPYVWPTKTIDKSIIWRGAIALKESLEVVDGAVLTISSGTKIVLSEGVGIKVSESRIVAKGRENRRITFTSDTEDLEHPWDEILLEHATGSIFTYSDIKYAIWGIHSHFTNLRVVNSSFVKNDGGMRFRSGPIEISGSLFSENRIGLRGFLANAILSGNEIVNNDTGIFIREKGDGITITGNNIYSNRNFNIRVGDFNIEDIDAHGNWWGMEDPSETIFDGRMEPGVGKVIFEPLLEEKLPFTEEEKEAAEEEEKLRIANEALLNTDVEPKNANTE